MYHSHAENTTPKDLIRAGFQITGIWPNKLAPPQPPLAVARNLVTQMTNRPLHHELRSLRNQAAHEGGVHITES